MEAEKRKLIKFSNYSLCVTIPKWVVKTLNWKKGDSVNMYVDTEAGKVVISENNSKVKRVKQKTVNSKPDKLRW